jgi:hypothetical protein
MIGREYDLILGLPLPPVQAMEVIAADDDALQLGLSRTFTGMIAKC